MKKRIIYPDDPDYLEHFYEIWGAGQSLTSRQAACVEADRPDQEEPQQEPAPSQPSHRLQQGHDLAPSESGED